MVLVELWVVPLAPSFAKTALRFSDVGRFLGEDVFGRQQVRNDGNAPYWDHCTAP